jgi:cytochrome bd-type quinol oxidase subunit 2
LDVSSRCPCLRDPRLVLLQVILLFAFPLAFDRLLEFLLVVSFLFLFCLVTKSCVLSVHSSMGRLRTMCGSRTGGWSLSGVMSD